MSLLFDLISSSLIYLLKRNPRSLNLFLPTRKCSSPNRRTSELRRLCSYALNHLLCCDVHTGNVTTTNSGYSNQVLLTLGAGDLALPKVQPESLSLFASPSSFLTRKLLFFQFASNDDEDDDDEDEDDKRRYRSKKAVKTLSKKDDKPSKNKKRDTDRDGIPDHLDEDDDHDAISDQLDDDDDGDGIPDDEDEDHEDFDDSGG